MDLGSGSLDRVFWPDMRKCQDDPRIYNHVTRLKLGRGRNLPQRASPDWRETDLQPPICQKSQQLQSLQVFTAAARSKFEQEPED